MLRTLFFQCFFILCTALVFNQTQAQLVWTTALDSVNSFSSPRSQDLSGDGVADIVIGGGIAGDSSDLGVIALNGVNGNVLWTSTARDQMFSSPIFIDVNGVSPKDVVMAGRHGQMVALNGSTGEILWEVYPDVSELLIVGKRNFFTGQVIPDQNDDGKSEILVCFGGGETLDTTQAGPHVAPGHIVVVSGLTGDVLARMMTPDSADTYSSLLVTDFGTNELWAVYGTGGETLPGGMWRTRLSDVMAEFPDNSELLHQSDSNGYVGPPSLGDLTGDGILDVIVNNHTGHISAINGATGNQIWEREIEDGEASSAPCIGKFNLDQTPDVSGVMAIGVWPHYTDYIRITLDGIDGSTIDSTSLVDWNISSTLAADLNNDGVDEIVAAFETRLLNASLDTIYTVSVTAINPLTWDTVFAFGPLPGANSFYTPHLADLDDNGLIDLVYASTEDSLDFYSDERLLVRRIELPHATPDHIAWGSYIGTRHDGIYYPQVPVVLEQIDIETELMFPGRVYSYNGQMVSGLIRSESELEFETSTLPAGFYLFRADGPEASKARKILSSGLH